MPFFIVDIFIACLVCMDGQMLLLYLHSSRPAGTRHNWSLEVAKVKQKTYFCVCYNPRKASPHAGLSGILHCGRFGHQLRIAIYAIP